MKLRFNNLYESTLEEIANIEDVKYNFVSAKNALVEANKNLKTLKEAYINKPSDERKAEIPVALARVETLKKDASDAKKAYLETLADFGITKDVYHSYLAYMESSESLTYDMNLKSTTRKQVYKDNVLVEITKTKTLRCESIYKTVGTFLEAAGVGEVYSDAIAKWLRVVGKKHNVCKGFSVMHYDAFAFMFYDLFMEYVLKCYKWEKGDLVSRYETTDDETE